MLDPQPADAPHPDSPSVGADPWHSPAADSALSAGPDVPAPRPPRTRWWLVIVTVLQLIIITVLQRPAPPDPQQLAEDKLATKVRAPSSDPNILLGKMLLGLKRLFPGMEDQVRAQFDQPTFGPPDAPTEVRIVMLLIGADEVGPPEASAAAAPPPMPFPGLGATPPPRDPARILDDVKKDLAPESPLHQDIAALRPLVELASRESSSAADVADAVAALPDETRDGLKQRHGWFADVLFTIDQPTAPVRITAEQHTTLFLLLVMVLGSGVALAMVAGLVLLIFALVKLFNGRIGSTFAPPQRIAVTTDADARTLWGRGLFLETVAVFLAGFLGLKLAQEVIIVIVGERPWLLWVTLLGQWLLLLCIFWPIVRGMSWSEWKTLMGWRAPRGVAREIGAGFCAYLAGLPIYFAMAIVAVVFMFIIEAIRKLAGFPPGPAPGNRITDIVGAGGPAVLITVFLLATIWAPVVEESIFRGAMYRTLRGRFTLLGAGFISSFMFAVMHGYLVAQLLIVFTLGMIFAVMREWRNSLVPCVTAHAMHNSFTLTVMLTAGWLMRG